ncbi:MAG: hypothetical protein QM811_04220 [Pirellulales bacterium]
MFDTVGETRAAITELMSAGFSHDEITVVCSDKFKEADFHEFEHEKPAGSYSPAAVAAGGAIGSALFGLAAVAAGIATGGIGLLVAGGTGIWTGGVAGGLIGAMMTRGFEREAANFYDQAVVQGRILVTVEDEHAEQAIESARLQTAGRILAAHGAQN